MSNRLRNRLFILIAIFFFLATHLLYFKTGFTWLDHGDIENKASILPLKNLGVSVLQRYGNTNYYRPVITWVNSLDYALFKDKPLGYHATNLFIFLLIMLISPFFLSAFVRLSYWEKTVIVFFICVHPLSWLPAGSISYRPELLYVLFTEICLICHMHYRQTGKMLWRYGTLVSFILALFSKETSLILVPLFIFLWEYFQKHKKGTKYNYIFFGEEILIAVIFSVLRISILPSLWTPRNYSMTFLESLGTRAVAAERMGTMLLNPLLPNLSDSIHVASIFTPESLLYIALAIGILFILWKIKYRNMTISALLTGIVMLPSLNIIPLPRFMAPHYMFFAMITSGLIIIMIYRKLPQRIKPSAFLLMLTVLAIMTIQTFQGGNRFKNDYTLFYPDVQTDNYFSEGHYYLGDYYYSQHNMQKAESEYESSLKRNPNVIAYVDRTSALIMLANVKYIEKKYDESEVLLSQAAQDPDPRIKEVIAYNRASLAFETGDYKKAEVIIESSSISWKYNLKAVYLLVSIYEKRGKKDEAVHFLKKVSQDMQASQKKIVEEMITHLK